MKVKEADERVLPKWLSEILSNWAISELTDIQVRALESGLLEQESMLVAAPTSSGKTLVGEMAMQLAVRSGRKVLYLVSHKALADQKYEDFRAKYGDSSENPTATVALSTGDREEGEVNSVITVATYEKALGLVVSGQVKPESSLVVADEFQIIGEKGRGALIEALCAVFLTQGVEQFIALTATTENIDDIAGWMRCKAVRSFIRNVPLNQHIWWRGVGSLIPFGQEQVANQEPVPTGGIIDAVSHLLDSGKGPILVFVETRRDASDLSEQFAKRRVRAARGLELAEQLDLFSEPTQMSSSLRDAAEKGVCFHTADLSAQERQVLEQGFVDSKFDVCFATSTLAAGVNYPFRTVVFAHISYRYGDRAGTNLGRSEYRNMSGRAGRLGLHDVGHSVLIPQNGSELAAANSLVLPQEDVIRSRLPDLSLRKIVLMLSAAKIASSRDEVSAYLKKTFYWYQTADKNLPKVYELEGRIGPAIDWLVENGLVEMAGDEYLCTPIGRAISSTGLLPQTAVNLVEILKANAKILDSDFDNWVIGLVHACCSSEEFRGERQTRFFPFPARSALDSSGFLSSKNLLIRLDRADRQLAACVHALAMYIEGESERKIAHDCGISAGAIARLASDVSWVLDGVHDISCVRDVGCSQTLTNKIGLLARRIRWGAPAEALDLIRAAAMHKVPGVGRQRAMNLVRSGLDTIHKLLGAERQVLVGILKDERRVNLLIEAANKTAGVDRGKGAQIEVAKSLGMKEIFERCELALGTEYEDAIGALLSTLNNVKVRRVDDGKRQNVPDLQVTGHGFDILLECKTCTKSPPLIKKEEAFSVLQKACDFDSSMRRVTVGKPAFDETSKSKAAASKEIGLLEHSVLMEAALRVVSGEVSADEFMAWLAEPGVLEVGRLSQRSAYAVLAQKVN